MKKLGLLLLVMLLMTSLVVVGCGQGETGEQTDKSQEPAQSSDKEEFKTVKLGVIQPITGAIAYGGQAAANGHKLAVKEINESGGITVNGEKYKIELLIEDSKGVPKESAAATTKLIFNDNVPLIMGDFTSSSTFASAEIANREGVPIFSPLSSAAKLTTSGFEYFFRGRVTTHNNLDGAAKFFADLGHKKIAMLAINDDWGRGDTTLFPPAWEKLGVEVTAIEYFDQGQTDFYPVLSKIADTKPDAIFVTASTEPASLIFKQAREVVPEIDMLTSGGIDPVKTLELAGDAAEGVWFWSVDGPATPAIKEFDKKYEEEFGIPSMSNAKSGYDVAQIVAIALEKAGTVTDSKKIRDALAETEYDGYMGHYNFDETGDSFLKMNFGKFENGSFTITKGE